MDYPADSDGDNRLLKDLEQLEEIHAQVDQLYDKYQELEHSVDKLGDAVESHPETDYENNLEFSLYNGNGKTEIDIEQDIAVMIGTTSQKWREVERLFGEVNQSLYRYREELRGQDNPLPEYNMADDSRQELREGLRETEKKIEDISVETYFLLEEQLSPESRTVLRPNSSQPIASD